MGIGSTNRQGRLLDLVVIALGQLSDSTVVVQRAQFAKRVANRGTGRIGLCSVVRLTESLLTVFQARQPLILACLHLLNRTRGVPSLDCQLLLCPVQ